MREDGWRSGRGGGEICEVGGTLGGKGGMGRWAEMEEYEEKQGDYGR